MTFANWYSSKYPFIASEEEFARLQDAWKEATKAEREACAKMADERSYQGPDFRWLATDIRNRSKGALLKSGAL